MRDVPPLCLSQIFARTEVDTHVLAFSEGALVPCSVSADMTLAQVTVELVKVRHVTTTNNKKFIACTCVTWRLGDCM